MNYPIHRLFFFLLAGILFFNPLILGAQSFGFRDYEEDEPEAEKSSFFQGISIKLNGGIDAELKAFFNDFESGDTIKNAKLGDIFQGNLDLSVSSQVADGVLKFKLAPVFDGSFSPITIDEAFARVYFGPVNIEGGLRKLTWGKADSFGPLDIINPLDYSDLSALSDPQSIKLARPLLHISWNMGMGNTISNSKLEAVFVPWFEGHNFADSGRWAPGQITTLPGSVADGIASSYTLPESERQRIENALEEWINSGAISGYYPDTQTLEYAQAGLRFTASMGSSDWGFQYYYGRLARPAVNLSAEPGFYTGASIDASRINIDIAYNPVHQIGLDFARVIGGLNFRAEAGANITSDLDGTNGSIYNPSLFWCIGFDRDVLGIDFNVQGTGSIRLSHDKIDDNPMLDTEAGKDMTSSRITLVLSKKFFRDELEIRARGLWGIEDQDFLVMPGILWSRNGVSAELSAGFFGGNKKGELGQYRDNCYIKATLGYRF